MRERLNRIDGIEVLSCNDNKATIEVMKDEALDLLRETEFKVHNEESNIYLVIV